MSTKKITAYVDEDYLKQIENLSDNLDITESKAANIILASGLSNWETEIKIVQLEAKLDLIIESFAEEEDAKERMKEAVREFNEKKSMDIPIDDTDEPTDAMKSIGITPDSWDG